MAKKAAKDPSIVRENCNWGVRLSVKPLTVGVNHGAMEITVDIHNPTSSRAADIRTRFSGVPFSFPLGTTDTVVWLNQMHSMQTMAREIAAELAEALHGTPAAKKTAKKAPTKKAAKKAAKGTSKV